MFNINKSLSLVFLSTTLVGSLLFPGTVSAEDVDSDKLPDGLHPKVEEKAEELVEEAEDIGIDIKITDDFRSFEEQDALFAKGRTVFGNIVTNARGGESYHNYGLAIDFALEVDGDVIWDVDYDGNDNDKSDWFEVADIAKDLGFDWGGDWDDFKDYPHLEMTFDHSIKELQEGDHDLFEDEDEDKDKGED